MAVAAVATGVVGGIVVVVLTAVGVRFVTQLYFLKEIRRGRHHDLGRIFPRKTSFEKATAVVDDDGFAALKATAVVDGGDFAALEDSGGGHRLFWPQPQVSSQIRLDNSITQLNNHRRVAKRTQRTWGVLIF